MTRGPTPTPQDRAPGPPPGRGSVLFVGCGPGAADLLTLRAVGALARADIVIWGRSMIPEEVIAEHARAGVQVIAWPPATLADLFAAYDRARDEGLVVVRLKSGDPMLFGAMEPELSAARERGLDVEIVPGVSALGAAAAALGHEIARPGAPLVLGDAADPAGCRPGVALFMSGGDPSAPVAALQAHGLPPDTPCALAIGVSRPEEILATCRLDELGEQIADLGRGPHTMVFAEPAGPPSGPGGVGPAN